MKELPPTVVQTPEGLALPFATADFASRMAAMIIDLVVVFVVLLVGGGLLALVLGPAVLMLAMFFLRQGYFLWFEARGNGSTLGKRRLHLRVVRADGGPLTVEVLLARNLTREVEFFVPGMIFLAPQYLFADHAGPVRVVASLWVLLLLLFPLFNSYRARIGDLLAGTRVVVAPPVALLRDLADRDREQRAAAGFHFTAQQLDVYGEKELTVLEDVLRKARGAGGKQALRKVAEAICRRIGYQDPAALERSDAFLH
ncbi:MAG: RDD family protein, partial [Planctomycetota bacterium]